MAIGDFFDVQLNGFDLKFSISPCLSISFCGLYTSMAVSGLEEKLYKLSKISFSFCKRKSEEYVKISNITMGINGHKIDI